MLPAPFPPPPSRRSLSGLLRRNLGFHLPSRRQNHLIPSPLQSSLPVVTVGAPAFALLIFVALRSLLLLFRGHCLGNLILEVVACNQIRLSRLLRLLRRWTGASTRGRLVSKRRWLERNGRLPSITTVLVLSPLSGHGSACICETRGTSHTVSSRPARIRSVVL